MNLEALRTKYQLGKGAKYEPDPQCKRCQGAGEHFSTAHKGLSFCACLFFAPEWREEALGLLAQAAHRLRDPTL